MATLDDAVGAALSALTKSGVCEQVKGAGAHTHRGAFYYLLVKHHGKESVYA